MSITKLTNSEILTLNKMCPAFKNSNFANRLNAVIDYVNDKTAYELGNLTEKNIKELNNICPVLKICNLGTLLDSFVQRALTEEVVTLTALTNAQINAFNGVGIKCPILSNNSFGLGTLVQSVITAINNLE